MVLYKPFEEKNLHFFTTFSLFTFTYYFKYGGIAQLGERLNGIQEVSGSIPLISTKKKQVDDLLLFLSNPQDWYITNDSKAIVESHQSAGLYIITRQRVSKKL